MELQQSIPIQVQCPQCEKNFLVSTERLAFGQAQFQCTSCTAIFATNWDGQWDSIHKPTVLIKKSQEFKKCVKCTEDIELESNECKHCGVIQQKRKVMKVSHVGIPTAVITKWDQLKENYNDEAEHLRFIQFCAGLNQLVFASMQYRVILQSNPADPVAIKMQKALIQLSQFKQQREAHVSNATEKRVKLKKIIVISSLVLISLGLISDAFRPVMALGAALLFFVFFLHFGKGPTEV